MSNLLKGKHVLLCSEITELGLQYVDILFKNHAKTVTITNNNEDMFKEIENKFKYNKFYHVAADLNKIEDMEEAYKKILKNYKKIDIVINNKELVNDLNWEDEITIQINAMICSTLLAIKHLGKMNGGKGCKVINTVMLFDRKQSSHTTTKENTEDEESSNYGSIKNLLTDLDHSFGNSYYYINTGVKILTMCTNMEIQSDIELKTVENSTASAPQGSTYIFTRFDNVEKRLLAVIKDKVSDLQPSFVNEKPHVTTLQEEFQIVVET